MFGFWVHLLKFQFNSASGLIYTISGRFILMLRSSGRNGKDLNQDELTFQVKKLEIGFHTMNLYGSHLHQGM